MHLIEPVARTADMVLAVAGVRPETLLGHRHAEIAKRIGIAATAIFRGMTVDAMSDLDLSCTPPLGSPWDAVQAAAQARARQAARSQPEG